MRIRIAFAHASHTILVFPSLCRDRFTFAVSPIWESAYTLFTALFLQFCGD